MKSFLHTLTTALVLAVVAPWALSAASEDETAVRGKCAEFVAAWNRHDPEALAAAWAENGDFINPFGRAARGRTEIEKLFAEEHGAAMRHTTYTAIDVGVRFPSPTVAVSEWSAEVANVPDPAGSAALHVFKHRVVAVLVKKDGHWEIMIARPYAFLPAPRS